MNSLPPPPPPRRNTDKSPMADTPAPAGAAFPIPGVTEETESFTPEETFTAGILTPETQPPSVETPETSHDVEPITSLEYESFEPLLPSSPEKAAEIVADDHAEIVFTPEVQAAAQALLDFIGDDECSEVLLNGPNDCSRKIRGARYHSPEVNFYDPAIYHKVINDVILGYCDTSDRIDGKTVLIEGQMELPSASGKPSMVARVHIIAPPGVNYAKVTIAKKPRTDLTLDDMAQTGSMTREMADFLKAVARGRATFVVSGPTGAGKSTLLQAMSHFFDQNDRVVVIEETPELRLPLGDVVYLKATLEKPGMNPSDVYTLEFWAKQANRMRMDRVIVGETRGAEMAEWLVAANSGAEGSATTVHAESPRRTLDKMLGLASRAIGSMSEDQLRREIAATVDIIIQVTLIDGRHVVTGIEEVVNTIAQQTGQILSNPLFAYDRARGIHVVKGRPSDEFIAQLGNRGVPLNAAWFRSPVR